MENNKMFPKLRFPEFNEPWENIKLGDILEFISTNSYSRSELNLDEGEIKNIHYGDIHTKFPTLVDCSIEKIPYINSEVNVSEFKKEQYCRNGDLIIADASENYEDIGKAIELINVKNKVVSGLHTILARDKNNKTALGFKGYLFLNEALRKDIKIITNGISVLGVSKNNIAKLNVNIPSYEEQEKIVSFLSLIDKKLIFMQKKHKNIEKIKESIIQKIFSKQFDKLNNESWNTIYLRDVTSIPKKEKLKSIDGRKLLTVKLHCKGVEVNNNNIKPKITKRGRPYFERYEGELLIGRQNFHNGGIGFVTKELDSGICSNAITSLKIDESKINPNYLYYYLSRKSFYEKSEVVMGGTGQKELSEKELLKLKIGLPIKEDQKIISNILQSFDYKINLCNNELISLNEFKKGLLQKMFV